MANIDEIKNLLEEHHDKLTPRESDIVKLLFGTLNGGKRQSIECISELFGTSVETVVEGIESAYKKMGNPKEMAYIIQMEKVGLMRDDSDIEKLRLLSYYELICLIFAGLDVEPEEFIEKSKLEDLENVFSQIFNSDYTNFEGITTKNFSTKEVEVLNEVFGLKNGQPVNRCYQRISQEKEKITAKCLRKLRHPVRAKELAIYMQNLAEV